MAVEHHAVALAAADAGARIELDQAALGLGHTSRDERGAAVLAQRPDRCRDHLGDGHRVQAEGLVGLLRIQDQCIVERIDRHLEAGMVLLDPAAQSPEQGRQVFACDAENRSAQAVDRDRIGPAGLQQTAELDAVALCGIAAGSQHRFGADFSDRSAQALRRGMAHLPAFGRCGDVLDDHHLDLVADADIGRRLQQLVALRGRADDRDAAAIQIGGSLVVGLADDCAIAVAQQRLPFEHLAHGLDRDRTVVLVHAGGRCGLDQVDIETAARTNIDILTGGIGKIPDLAHIGIAASAYLDRAAARDDRIDDQRVGFVDQDVAILGRVH